MINDNFSYYRKNQKRKEMINDLLISLTTNYKKRNN